MSIDTSKMYMGEIRPPSNNNNNNNSNVKGRSNCNENDDAIEKQCTGNILDNDRECSISSNSNSPTPPLLQRYERGINGERHFGLLRQLSQRFGLRSYDDPIYSSANDDDNQSSSTDSCSSSQAAAAATTTTTSTSINNAKSWELQQQNHEKLEHTSKTTTTKITQTHYPNDTNNTLDDINSAIEQQQNMIHDATNDGKEAISNKRQTQSHNEQIHYNSKECRFDNRTKCTRLQRRSTSTIRKAFESLSLTTRSLSCSGSTLPSNKPSEQTDNEYSTSRNSSNTSPVRSPIKYASNLELDKKSCDMTLIVSNQQHQQQHLYESRNRNIRSLAHDTNHSSICNMALDTANKTNKQTKQPPQRILRQPVSYTYLKGISGLPTQRVPRSSVCCQYARR